MNEFISETRKINNESGLICSINKAIKCNNSTSLDKFNEAMQKRLNEIDKARTDRYNFNEMAQEVKKLLHLRNSYLRRLKLNELLHFNNYSERNE